jgi:hypothetical protein
MAHRRLAGDSPELFSHESHFAIGIGPVDLVLEMRPAIQLSQELLAGARVEALFQRDHPKQWVDDYLTRPFYVLPASPTNEV